MSTASPTVAMALPTMPTGSRKDARALRSPPAATVEMKARLPRSVAVAPIRTAVVGDEVGADDVVVGDVAAVIMALPFLLVKSVSTDGVVISARWVPAGGPRTFPRMGDAVSPGRSYRRHMVRRLVERWRAEDWRVEVAIAVIVAVVSATGAWVGDPAASGRTGAFPATVALCAGLVLVARRVIPMGVLGVVLVLLVLASVDGHQLGTTPVALLFVSHAAGRWAPGARGLVALVAIWLVFGGLALWGDPYFRSPIAVLAPVIYALPFAVGRYVAARTERTEREWDEARDAERAQIARELHDIVTHALTGITVQAGTARHLRLGGESATETFAQIETQGRQALGDLRRMLDLLREDHPGQDRPTPTIGDLRQLVDAHRRAHGPVNLTLEGGWQEMGASVGLAIYRLVQEALTNVARHARGAPAQVVVACGARDVRVSIEDSGPGPALGRPDSYGLVGMRERVELFGGTFDAGPRPEGGFAVRALIPCGR